MGQNGLTLNDTSATFNQDMAGSLCWMTSGKNAGLAREIAGASAAGSYPTLQVADGTFTRQYDDDDLPEMTHTTAIGSLAALRRQVGSWSISVFSDGGGGKVQATTDDEHTFVTGDSVWINGYAAYKGTWTITVVDSTHFTFVDTWYAAGANTSSVCLASSRTGNFYLTADIDASATATWNNSAGWLPIDNFVGTFDGDGYTITGITMDSAAGSLGFFGQRTPNSGTPDVTPTSDIVIANLTLADVTIDGGYNSAPFAAWAICDTADYHTYIQNCHVTGTSILTDTGSGSGEQGGFVGMVSGGNWENEKWVYIRDCTTNCTVDVSDSIDGFFGEIGGFVGYAGANCSFINCRATGDVNGLGNGDDDGNDVGGFVGYVDGVISDWALFTDCSSTGDVIGYRVAGGFCGFNDTGTFTRCSSRGSVTANDYAGGFLGDNFYGGDIVDCYSWGDVTASGGPFLNAGGFVQYDEGDNTTTNAYSIGLVTGKAGSIGGFCQYNQGGVFTEGTCFWDTDTSGTETSDEGIGHTTSWMKTQANYEAAGWDFTTTWEMDEAYVSADITETKLTFVEPFPYEIVTGDRYCVSGVPFKARCWPLQDKGVSRFNRWDMVGGALKCRKLSGFTGNDNAYWRVSAYRGNKKGLEDKDVYIDVTQNPADSAGAINVDGVDLEPYIEQIAAGVTFELTDAEFNVSWSDSRKVGN